MKNEENKLITTEEANQIMRKYASTADELASNFNGLKGIFMVFDEMHTSHQRIRESKTQSGENNETI